MEPRMLTTHLFDALNVFTSFANRFEDESLKHDLKYFFSCLIHLKRLIILWDRICLKLRTSSSLQLKALVEIRHVRSRFPLSSRPHLKRTLCFQNSVILHERGALHWPYSGNATVYSLVPRLGQVSWLTLTPASSLLTSMFISETQRFVCARQWVIRTCVRVHAFGNKMKENSENK